MLGRERAEPKAVNEAGFGGRAERGERFAQAAEIRAVQAVAVDDCRRNHPHRDAGRARGDGPEELLPPRRIDLLRVIEETERANAVVAQALVVEQHAGRDERPGEAAAPGLVRARHEADAESAVEGEELAARATWRRHGGEHSA